MGNTQTYPYYIDFMKRIQQKGPLWKHFRILLKTSRTRNLKANIFKLFEVSLNDHYIETKTQKSWGILKHTHTT